MLWAFSKEQGQCPGLLADLVEHGQVRYMQHFDGELLAKYVAHAHGVGCVGGQRPLPWGQLRGGFEKAELKCSNSKRPGLSDYHMDQD